MPRVRSLVTLAALITWFGTPAAFGAGTPGGESLAIDELLKSGWEVAGYASNFDSRSTFILFKKAGVPYLVQCLAGYDVTREPRVFRNCYELR